MTAQVKPLRLDAPATVAESAMPQGDMWTAAHRQGGAIAVESAVAIGLLLAFEVGGGSQLSDLEHDAMPVCLDREGQAAALHSFARLLDEASR